MINDLATLRSEILTQEGETTELPTAIEQAHEEAIDAAADVDALIGARHPAAVAAGDDAITRRDQTQTTLETLTTTLETTRQSLIDKKALLARTEASALSQKHARRPRG